MAPEFVPCGREPRPSLHGFSVARPATRQGRAPSARGRHRPAGPAGAGGDGYVLMMRLPAGRLLIRPFPPELFAARCFAAVMRPPLLFFAMGFSSVSR